MANQSFFDQKTFSTNVYHQGRLWLLARRYTVAATCFKQFLALHPKHRVVGCFYKLSEKLAKSEEVTNKYKGFVKNEKAGLAIMSAMQDLDQALIGLSANSAKVLLQVKLDLANDAIEQFIKLCELKPICADADLNLTLLYLERAKLLRTLYLCSDEVVADVEEKAWQKLISHMGKKLKVMSPPHRKVSCVVGLLNYQLVKESFKQQLIKVIKSFIRDFSKRADSALSKKNLDFDQLSCLANKAFLFFNTLAGTDIKEVRLLAKKMCRYIIRAGGVYLSCSANVDEKYGKTLKAFEHALKASGINFEEPGANRKLLCCCYYARGRFSFSQGKYESAYKSFQLAHRHCSDDLFNAVLFNKVSECTAAILELAKLGLSI